MSLRDCSQARGEAGEVGGRARAGLTAVIPIQVPWIRVERVLVLVLVVNLIHGAGEGQGRSRGEGQVMDHRRGGDRE